MAATVLITGGAGFIGRALASRLLERGVEVTLLDSLHPQVHPPGERLHLPDGARLLTGDVTHADNWRTVLALTQPHTVVHLAAETGTAQSMNESSRHGRVNVVGTTQMMDAFGASANRPEHIVLASSRAVYGEGLWRDAEGALFYPGRRRQADLLAGRWDPVGPTGLPATPVDHRAATTIAQPVSVYAATKLAQEHLLTAWGCALGIDISVLRLQNVYGPGQSITNQYSGVLAHFARVASQGGQIEVFEDGAIQRDFVFVDDAAAALEAAILNRPEGARVVDVGSGRSASLREVAQSIADLADAPQPTVSATFRSGDVRAACCDLTDASEQLGYAPTVSLLSGLERLLSWADVCAQRHNRALISAHR